MLERTLYVLLFAFMFSVGIYGIKKIPSYFWQYGTWLFSALTFFCMLVVFPVNYIFTGNFKMPTNMLQILFVPQVFFFICFLVTSFLERNKFEKTMNEINWRI